MGTPAEEDYLRLSLMTHIMIAQATLPPLGWLDITRQLAIIPHTEYPYGAWQSKGVHIIVGQHSFLNPLHRKDERWYEASVRVICRTYSGDFSNVQFFKDTAVENVEKAVKWARSKLREEWNQEPQPWVTRPADTLQ